jgi:hypothetical protein
MLTKRIKADKRRWFEEEIDKKYVEYIYVSYVSKREINYIGRQKI